MPATPYKPKPFDSKPKAPAKPKQTPAEYQASVTAGLAKVPGAQKPKPKQTPAQYQASLTAGFANVPGAQVPGAGGGPAPQTVPHVDPFYNGQDLQTLADVNFQTATDTQSIDDALKQLGIDTAYNKTQLDKSAKENTGATNDNAAGRGIFGSSIAQGALADIEASRVTQRGRLEDALAAATISGEAKKGLLAEHAAGVVRGLDANAVANAAAINNTIPPADDPAPAPAPAAAPAAVPPAAQWITTSYKNAQGHPVRVYGDGHKEVLVNGAWKRV